MYGGGGAPECRKLWYSYSEERALSTGRSDCFAFYYMLHRVVYLHYRIFLRPQRNRSFIEGEGTFHLVVGVDQSVEKEVGKRDST